MIEQNVQVVRCQDKRLWVRMGAQSGCSACDNGNGCGAGLFARLLRGKPVTIELARNELYVEPGQILTLALPESVFLKMVFASYGWPLLAALAGAVAGHGLGLWLSLGPLTTDLCTLISGLLAGLLALRLVRRLINPGSLLSSVHTTVYFSSTTPNMCSRNQPN